MLFKIAPRHIGLLISLILAGLWTLIVVSLLQGWGDFKINMSLAFIGVITMPYVLLTLFNLTLYKAKAFPFLMPFIVILLVLFFFIPANTPADIRFPLFIFFLFFVLVWGGYHMIYWNIIKPRLSKRIK